MVPRWGGRLRLAVDLRVDLCGFRGRRGRYFENCRQAIVEDPTACGADAAGYALDPAAAEQL